MEPLLRPRIGLHREQALARVLLECPYILQLVPKASLPYILSSSTHARQAVHSYVQVVHIEDNVALLAEGGWTSLHSLTISNFCKSSLRDVQKLSRADWPQLRKLVLRGQAPIIAMQPRVMGCLVKGRWPLLEQLDLSLHDLSSEVTTLLACSDWPKLRHLELQRCSLHRQNMQHIAQGKWPELQTLDLKGNNGLTASAIAQLCKGDWPHLQLLVLGSGVDAAGIASIAQAMSFSLQQLGLSRAAFSAPAARYFSCAEWPKLTCLQLYKCGLNAAGLSWLVQADLPALKLLDLTGNAIGVPEMTLVCNGQWCGLETLTLSDSRLGAGGMAVLKESSIADKWPKMRMLDFSCNDGFLDEGAIGQFVQGKWLGLEKLSFGSNSFTGNMMLHLSACSAPLLKAVDFSDCGLEKVALALLMRCNWPLLQFLSIQVHYAFRQGEVRLPNGLHRVRGAAVVHGLWPRLEVIYVGRNSKHFDEWELPTLHGWFHDNQQTEC